MDVQTKRDAVQKNLEEFKATNNRFMAGINKKVSQGKEKHDELTNEVRIVECVNTHPNTLSSYCLFGASDSSLR